MTAVTSVLFQTQPLPSLQHPEIVALVALYFAICIGIAVWAARRTRTATDFFLAGRGIGIWALGVASMASTLSGFTFIGGPGLVYSIGIGALFIVLSASITGVMGINVIGRRLRLLGEAREMVTIPDAIGARYRSRAAQGLSAAAILVATIGYMATNLLAMGFVIDAIFATGLTRGIIIGALVTLGYSVTGGMLAGVYTDLFQGAIMAGASLMVFVVALQDGGGMTSITTTIMAHDPEWFGPWGKLSVIGALGFFVVFGIGSLGQPHVIHKYYMIRDPRQLRWYPLLMTGAMLVTLLLYLIVGLAMKAKVLAGERAPLAIADHATPLFLLEQAPVLLAGVVFAGVFAAIMSSVNSFMNIGAAAVTRDLPKAFGRSVGNELLVGRVSTVVLTALATVLAIRTGLPVALLGVFGFSLYAATLVPSVAIGLNWMGGTRKGALASIGVALVMTIGLETAVMFKRITLPAGVTAAGLTLMTAIVTFVLVSLATRRDAGADLDPDIRLVMER